MANHRKNRKKPYEHEWNEAQRAAFDKWKQGRIEEKPVPVHDPKLPTVVVTQSSGRPGAVARRFTPYANVYVASPFTNDDHMVEMYSLATHLVISGGPDIHPGHYGQLRTHADKPVPARDQMEFMLLGMALLDGLPVLGICRGHQVLSVRHGMELYQDVQKDGATVFSHRMADHGVYFQSRTGLWFGSAQGASKLPVNSLHHQSVIPDTVPKDWVITAMSNDGLVEGVQHKDLPLVGIQSHPELMRSRWSEDLFKGFLSWA